jgi:hypothetical protein
MKQILFSLTIALIFVIGQNCYAQATAGDHDPYRNLGEWKIYNNNWQYPGTVPPEYSWSNEDDWYGTQAAPTALEKAEWALDDINNYRAEKGLPPLTKNIFVETPQDNRGTPIIAGILLGILFVMGLILLLKSHYNMYQDEKYIKNRISRLNKKMEAQKEPFAEIWKEMTEERRRNNIGHFVQIFDREPAETEIVTGVVIL